MLWQIVSFVKLAIQLVVTLVVAIIHSTWMNSALPVNLGSLLFTLGIAKAIPYWPRKCRVICSRYASVGEEIYV